MSERESWAAMRERRMESAEVQDAYEMARRAHEFGAAIRSAREARGLTQSSLAQLMTTSQSAIARLEAGGVQPTLETLSRLTGALGILLLVGPDGVVAQRPGKLPGS